MENKLPAVCIPFPYTTAEHWPLIGSCCIHSLEYVRGPHKLDYCYLVLHLLQKELGTNAAVRSPENHDDLST